MSDEQAIYPRFEVSALVVKHFERNDYPTYENEEVEILFAASLEELVEVMATYKIEHEWRHATDRDRYHTVEFGQVTEVIGSLYISEGEIEESVAWKAHQRALVAAAEAAAQVERVKVQRSAERTEAAERAKLAELLERYGTPTT